MKLEVNINQISEYFDTKCLDINSTIRSCLKYISQNFLKI